MVADNRLCRETPTAKSIISLFEQLREQYANKMNLVIQPCSMLPEHLLPMIQVLRQDSTEIVMQIFNFVDYCGGAQKIDVQCKSYFLNYEALRLFLQSKGILENDGAQTDKDQETYYIANMSSYLNEAALDDDVVDKLNEQMDEIETSQKAENVAIEQI